MIVRACSTKMILRRLPVKFVFDGDTHELKLD